MKQNIVLLRSCVLFLNGIFLVGAVKAQFLSGYPGSSIPKKTVALGETMYTDSNRAAVISIAVGGRKSTSMPTIPTLHLMQTTVYC